MNQNFRVTLPRQSLRVEITNLLSPPAIDFLWHLDLISPMCFIHKRSKVENLNLDLITYSYSMS